jgi:zinc protease
MNLLKPTISLLLGLFLYPLTLLANTPIPIEHWKTKQGTPVYFIARHELPIVDIAVVFHAGSGYDAEKFGLASLTNQLMGEGTLHYNQNVLSKRFDDIGAHFSNTTNMDTASFNIRSLSDAKKFHQAIETLSDIVVNPNFPLPAFVREKNRALNTLQASHDDPAFLADQLFLKTLYGDKPYGHLPIGTQKGLKNISQNEIVDFYHSHYVAKNAFIVIVGDLSTNSAKSTANALLHEMPAGERHHLKFDLPIRKKMTITEDFESTQNNIRIGQLGIKQHDPDYFALKVGNYILGGDSLSSLLGKTIRGKEGLTYGIYSHFSMQEATGPFIIEFSSRNEKAEQAITLSKKILQDFITTGPDATELNFAKAYLTGSFPLQLDSNEKMLANLTQIINLHLPLNYLDTYVDNINQITEKDVKTAMNQHIYPSDLLTVMVGKK